MSERERILVLRDEAGVPFLLPQKVVEQEELTAFRVGDDDYLLPRKKLLASMVPDGKSADGAEGMAVRAPDGTHFLLTEESLELARVTSDEERAAVRHVLDAEVVGQSQLDFEIKMLGVQQLGVISRGWGATYVS